MTSITKKIIISLCLVGVLCCSGCIWQKTPVQKIASIISYMPLNYDEIASANFTRAETDLVALGYKIVKEGGGIFRVQHFTPNYIIPELDMYIYNTTLANGTNLTIFWVDYTPNADVPTRDDENEVNVAKEYIQSKCNEVCQVCNITLNWNNAKWTVNYVD